MSSTATVQNSKRLFSAKVTRAELRGVHFGRAGGHAPIAAALGVSVSTLSRRLTADEDFPLDEAITLSQIEGLEGVNIRVWSYSPIAARVVRSMRKDQKAELA